MRVLGGAKPNVINRLNAGIYRIVSRYGDANAKVEADVTVEAGKLTEATVSHSAARVTFKLVNARRRRGAARYAVDGADARRPGGHAERRRAADAHPRARARYSVTAKSSTGAYKRDFTLANGEVAQVEVLMQ